MSSAHINITLNNLTDLAAKQAAVQFTTTNIPAPFKTLKNSSNQQSNASGKSLGIMPLQLMNFVQFVILLHPG